MANQDDIDSLYACPLSEFLDRRKGLAAALRKAGQKDLAGTVASAAKPTPAAWAVNQLARRYPGELAALMDAGAAVRAELRASFAGRAGASPKAMANAQAEQRETVTALVPLARALLEAGGASASATVLDRVATTLTAISTTGTWGDGEPLRLTKELDPPGIEALAALVADVVPAPSPAPANLSAAREAPPSKDAEAALQAAAAAEQRAQAALQSAQAAVAQLRERREEQQAHAREARALAAELEQAAEQARKKAQTAAAAVQKADAEVEDCVRAERAARGELAAAEQAVTRTATERAAAEAAILRGRPSLR